MVALAQHAKRWLASLSPWRIDGSAAMVGTAGDGAKEQRVIIVGGGASGVLLAAHLLRARGSCLAVTLIERAPSIGQGLAYGTTHRRFLLNVRAANMSAFADAPDNFTQWLAAHRGTSGEADSGMTFVERRLYACYLASLIEPHLARRNGATHLHVRHGQAVTIDITPDAVVVILGNGTTVAGDVVVLATGNEMQPEQRLGEPYASPWLASDAMSFPGRRPSSFAAQG